MSEEKKVAAEVKLSLSEEMHLGLKKFWKVYLKTLVIATVMMRIVVVKTLKIALSGQAMRFSANQVLKKIILST